MKRTCFWTALACLAVGLPLYAMTDPANPTSLSALLGRLHTGLVHFPIALLMVAALVDLLGPRSDLARNTAAPLYGLGAVSAVAAVIAGLFLSLEGGYDETLLYWHKRLGIAAAVVAFVAWRMKAGAEVEGRPDTRGWYRGVVILLLVSLLTAGHLGGSLTHGPDYLTRYLPAPLAGLLQPPSSSSHWLQVGDLNDADLYADLVRPILETRCVTCHDSQQRKGELALDSLEGIRQGGVLVEGRSSRSEMMRRILLPEQHREHMPPLGKPQLSPLQTEILRWWIDEGAPSSLTAARGDVPPLVEQIFEDLDLPSRPSGIFALEVPHPHEEQLEVLRAQGISVMLLAQEEPFLHIRCPDAESCFGESRLSALVDVAPQVAWLDLRKTGIDDEGLAVLSNFRHLTRLYLQENSIADPSLKHLRHLQYLEYLNLFGTSVSDAGLEELKGLPALKSLYLWQTGVTQAGALSLQESLPNLEIDLGRALMQESSPSGASD